MRILAGLLLLLCQGCWADFPDSRWAWDGSVTDQGVASGDAGGSPRDGAAADQIVSDQASGLGDATSCTPGAFIRCAGQALLEQCDVAGAGTSLVDCSPHGCNAAQGRCNECTPGGLPQCQDAKVLVRCTQQGLLQQNPCPYGCESGQCCDDTDGDQFSACTGDCNEGDPEVFPEQTHFFVRASEGSFDYNCDGQFEPQDPLLANCQRVGSACQGEGWQGMVPACGEQGTFVSCDKKGGGCTENAASRRQACR